MTRIVKRYCLCAIVTLGVILFIYYGIFGREQYELFNYRDEFVAVAYVDESDNDDDNEHGRTAIEHLVNLTDFEYLLEPQVCNTNRQFLGRY